MRSLLLVLLLASMRETSTQRQTVKRLVQAKAVIDNQYGALIADEEKEIQQAFTIGWLKGATFEDIAGWRGTSIDQIHEAIKGA